MGVATGLQRQARCQTVVVLPQRDPAFVCQGDKLTTGLLIQACIGRVGDVLFHHRRVHGDARQAAVIDGTGCAPSLDGLGEQPLGPFLSDPFAPAGQRGRIDGRAMLKEHLTCEMLS